MKMYDVENFRLSCLSILSFSLLLAEQFAQFPFPACRVSLSLLFFGFCSLQFAFPSYLSDIVRAECDGGGGRSVSEAQSRLR